MNEMGAMVIIIVSVLTFFFLLIGGMIYSGHLDDQHEETMARINLMNKSYENTGNSLVFNESWCCNDTQDNLTEEAEPKVNQYDTLDTGDLI